MPKKIGFRVRLDGKSSAEVRKALKELQTKKPEKCKEILLEWASFIEGRAKEIVPVRTGNLKNSIMFEILKGGFAAEIGTHVEYAPYVEFGTSRMRAKPYLVPSFEQSVQIFLEKIRKELSK